uniref:Uncharacterized protein n=1 Tax=Aegilops tauschii subsp. strangulata TaxID=200361 RepID=A0A453KV95_AEGTS
MRILTSASLIRSSEEDGSKILDKLKIKVRLPSGKLVIGTLWKYDSYYNIAVVNIKASPELREACIHNQVPANVKLSQSKLVAIGRAFESGELMATGGTLLHGTTKFDCQQLMASTCKITKAGIGGLIVGSDGKFMGMSFYYKDGAPFLPFSILQKCLKHFNKFGRVVQLSLGLRIGSLQAEKLHVREQVHDSFPNAHGIYVQMILESKLAMLLPRLISLSCSMHKRFCSFVFLFFILKLFCETRLPFLWLDGLVGLVSWSPCLP